ncbi:hypothetical protein [Streptomyces liangshanensis]|uniref:hypothetical protein n=1 Tax=Streptomyces liangshanensis TaxID=2717324 RepID=UPI001AAE359B
MGGTSSGVPADTYRWDLPYEYDLPARPPGGWTVDDLLTLPDLPRRTELIDGEFVFASPQQTFHSVMTDLLGTGLRRTRPADLSYAALNRR